MTERKPFGVSWETWIDRQIREGMERGEFDGLPGHGKPIQDVDRPHDELWWVRDKLRREGVSYLPPTLALRKDVEDARAAIGEATTEAEVRQIVDRDQRADPLREPAGDGRAADQPDAARRRSHPRRAGEPLAPDDEVGNSSHRWPLPETTRKHPSRNLTPASSLDLGATWKSTLAIPRGCWLRQPSCCS